MAEVLNDQQIVFTAVGTPPDEDGSADLKYVLQVAKTIGENLNRYLVVVTKAPFQLELLTKLLIQ